MLPSELVIIGVILIWKEFCGDNNGFISGLFSSNLLFNNYDKLAKLEEDLPYRGSVP